MKANEWDTSYEWKAVTLLALGFGRPLPASFGWALLTLSLIGTIFIPLSGFLLVIPQALYILVVSRQAGSSLREGGNLDIHKSR